jgi:hypothetical protein
MFGGSSQQAYSDLRKFDPLRYEWFLLNSESKAYQPEERFGHTLNKYRHLVVMFGGAGHFNQEIKKRETYCDLKVFDIFKQEWLDPVIERDNSGL